MADEIADVVMFAMLLADRLGIDLAEAIKDFQTIWINPYQVEDLRVVAEFIRVLP